MLLRIHQKPEWLACTKLDASERRGMWFRTEPPWDQACSNPEVLKVIEICAGREGDDAYVRLSEENTTKEVLWALSECLAYARYAIEIDDE